MDAVFARSRKIVQDQLKRFGGAATISRTSGGGYDDEGNAVAVTNNTRKTRALYRDGSFYNAGSYLAGKATALLDYTYKPEPQDTLTLGGVDYTIASVHPMMPDGINAICYTVVIG